MQGYELKENFLTSAQAAEKFSCSSEYILRLCRGGELHGAQKIGVQWLIPIKSLELYKKLKTRHKKQNAEARRAKKRAKK